MNEYCVITTILSYLHKEEKTLSSLAFVNKTWNHEVLKFVENKLSKWSQSCFRLYLIKNACALKTKGIPAGTVSTLGINIFFSTFFSSIFIWKMEITKCF